MGGGGKGGGGGGGGFTMPTPAPSPYEAQLASMASDIYNSTNPLRQTYISDWMNFLTPQRTLRPGATPTRTPIYGTPAPSMFRDAVGRLYDSGEVRSFPSSMPPSDVLDKFPSNYRDFIFNGQRYILNDKEHANEIGYLTPIPGSGGGQTITGYNETYSPEDYITSRFDPNNLPGYTPQYDIARRGLESQYSTARDQILANTPRGGAMADALARLELGRAETVGELPYQVSSPLIMDMLNKSYGAAFNAPSQSIAGLSAANQGYTSTQNAMINAAMQQQAIQQSSANSKSSGLGMLGLGMGSFVGSMFGSPKAPWIFGQ